MWDRQAPVAVLGDVRTVTAVEGLRREHHELGPAMMCIAGQAVVSLWRAL